MTTKVDPVKDSDKLKDRIWLSIVVIGRNEALNLPRLFSSLPSADDIEWLYVDSYSEDNSAVIAADFKATVFRVKRDSVRAPATGRYIGTREASGRWILYLDGDMVLRDQFRQFLNQLKKNEDALPAGTAGFVGRTRNICFDREGSVIEKRDYVVLSRHEMGPVSDWGKPAGYHGGAVLYLRQSVLETGSWNPAVYQLEEVDLYCRIRAQGGVLRAVDLPMVDHRTAYLGWWTRLKQNFQAGDGEKKLCGAGQVVAARYKEGTLLKFIGCYPFPFIILLGLITAPLFYLIWPPLPLIINLLIVLWLAVIKRWYFYLVYLGNLLQMIRGLNRYRPFEPAYERFTATFND